MAPRQQLHRNASTPDLRGRPRWLEEALEQDLLPLSPSNNARSAGRTQPAASSSRSPSALTADALAAHQSQEASRQRSNRTRKRSATVPTTNADGRPYFAFDEGVTPRLQSRQRAPPEPLETLREQPVRLARDAAFDARLPSPQLQLGPNLGGWEATSALSSASSGRGPKRFELFQPVTIVVEKKPGLFSREKKVKQYRAIIVNRLDEYTYSVRIIPKSYPSMAAQFYRWHWFHGDRKVAVQEGAAAHAAGKWELIEKQHVSQIIRASKKVVLDL